MLGAIGEPIMPVSRRASSDRTFWLDNFCRELNAIV